jgi:hypothetical protein
MPELKTELRLSIRRRALGLLALLAGCHVGPPYHAPAPPAVTAPNYKESTVNFQDADGWKVASPQDAMIRGNWWEVFNDPELNALEEQLNINNQNLKEYFQNYMAARATIAEARSQYWPTITANPSWNRSKSSGTLSNSTQANTGKQSSTLWNAPIDVSWTPDFWGKIRNEVHEAQYASQVSAADLQLEKLTEQASLAEYFFEIRGQDMLQQILERDRRGRSEIAGLQPGAVRHRRRRLHLRGRGQDHTGGGAGGGHNVGLLRAQYEHAIAMLLGKIPTDFSIPSSRCSTRRLQFPPACPRSLSNAGPTLPRPSARSPRPTPHRHRLRRVLPASHHQRQRRIRELHVDQPVQLAQPRLVHRPIGRPNDLRRLASIAPSCTSTSLNTTQTWPPTGRPCSPPSSRLKTPWRPRALFAADPPPAGSGEGRAGLSQSGVGALQHRRRSVCRCRDRADHAAQ